MCISVLPVFVSAPRYEAYYQASSTNLSPKSKPVDVAPKPVEVAPKSVDSPADPEVVRLSI